MLTRAGRGEITTELAPAEEAGPFWYAEDYHQQYLHKNPNGYCNHGPNGLPAPCIADLPAQTNRAPAWLGPGGLIDWPGTRREIRAGPAHSAGSPG